MPTQQLEWIWLDARETLDAADLAHASGMSVEEIEELVDYGALAPMEADRADRASRAAPARIFSAACVTPLRTAGRLRRDFDLDLFAMAMLMDYLGRIDTLEQQVRALQARLPSGLPGR